MIELQHRRGEFASDSSAVVVSPANGLGVRRRLYQRETESDLSIECHKWEAVEGRRFRPLLRLWDSAAEQYVSEPGYIDCFASPETAELAAVLRFGVVDGDFLERGTEVFDGKKIKGNVFSDPIRQGPFPSMREVSLAAEDCPWDEERHIFTVDVDAMIKISILLDSISDKVQADSRAFMAQYVYRCNGDVAIRRVRLPTSRMLKSGRLPFYSGEKKKRPSRFASLATNV